MRRLTANKIHEVMVQRETTGTIRRVIVTHAKYEVVTTTTYERKQGKPFNYFAMPKCIREFIENTSPAAVGRFNGLSATWYRKEV